MSLTLHSTPTTQPHIGAASDSPMKRWQPTAVITALARLVGGNGIVNTAAAVLNRDAATGFFSNDPGKLRAFKKQAWRLARRTVDESFPE